MAEVRKLAQRVSEAPQSLVYHLTEGEQAVGHGRPPLPQGDLEQSPDDSSGILGKAGKETVRIETHSTPVSVPHMYNSRELLFSVLKMFLSVNFKGELRYIQWAAEVASNSWMLHHVDTGDQSCVIRRGSGQVQMPRLTTAVH